MRNLHQLFVLYTASQIIGGDFAKFCGILRIRINCLLWYCFKNGVKRAINCPQTAQFWPFFEHLLKWFCIIFILIHLRFMQEPHFPECIKILRKAWIPCLDFTDFSWVKKLLETIGKFWTGRSFTRSLTLKFIHSKKATKFCEISTNYLSYILPVK